MKKFFMDAAALVLFVNIFFTSTCFAQSAKDENDFNEDHPDLAVEFEFERTKDPSTGTVPRERLLEAIKMFNQQQAQKKNSSVLSTATWIERGPDNVGGRTRAIMFDPNDATHKKVWACGADGGLWYTNDITVTSPSWMNVNDFWANLSASCIAFDPSSTNIFYVGTGEGWDNISSAVRGLGIWKTTDGGLTWNQLSSTNNSTFYYGIEKISVTSNGNIFAATKLSGVQLSTNGGNSWTKVLGSGTGASTNNAADLEIGADGTIYASMGFTGSTDGIYSSSTGAAGTWIKLNTGTNGFPTTGFHRIELACAPSNANRIYAMVCNTNNTLLNIYTSIDKGATWTTCTQPQYTANCSTTIPDITHGQAWYNLILGVDPNNESTVLAGGLIWMKSTDAGNTWSQISLHWVGGCYSYTHTDQHAVLFEPGSSSTAIFGDDGGVYYATDVNNAAPNFLDKNGGYRTAQFYSCAIHPAAGQNYFLAGAQDNGTQQFTSAAMNSTTMPTGGDGTFCFIDQVNPTYQISSQQQNVYRLSTNNWSNYSTLVNDANHGSFVNPADYDNQNGILYTGYSGTQIQRISGIRTTPAISQFTVTAMSAMPGAIRVSPYSPTGTTNLFVGTTNSKLFKITNAESANPVTTNISGASWQANSTISCIEIGASEQDILITFSNYGVNSVWRTTDGGTTWTNKDNSSLPDMPIRWAVYNPNNLNEVFLATEVGVWSTPDITLASPSWIANSNGLANVRVDMLRYRISDKEMIAATHGRGLFSTSVFNQNVPVDETYSYYKVSFFPNPFSDHTTLKISSPEKIENAALRIFDVCGREVKTISINSNEIKIEKGNLERGIYFYEVRNEKNIFGKGKLIVN